MPLKVEILPAQLEDVPLLASLRGGGGQLEQTMRGYMQGSYSPQFAEADRIVFVARIDNEFAGYVSGHRTTRFNCDGELQWLNVAEAFRGKGVSDALIQRVVEWFLSNSIFNVCVNVEPDNIAGRKVYFRHGASELDSHWLVWPDQRMKKGRKNVR
jgi:GNAT superfamily N-acetyltransferase